MALGARPHAGPDSDRFREVCRLGEFAAALGEVRGSRVAAEVAIVFDYQAQWAAMGPAMPSSALDYPEIAQQVHRLWREQGITADVVHPGADLSRYAVVVVPTLYLVTDADAAHLAAAAHRGAHVLVTYFSGLVDEHDHVRLGGYPGAFAELLGVRVEEFAPLLPGEQVALTRGTGTVWSEFATFTGAEPLISYAAGPLAGRPALTRTGAGQGTAWYLGTRLDDATMGSVLGEIAAAAGVRPAAAVGPGVEAVRRRSDRGSWLFLLNHTDAEASVAATGHDLLTGAEVGPTVALPPGGCAVVRER